ncbi:hypothetical protein BC939DRAFT_471623, partial [Gamsiella multidivaricata]|uniref:uncharacterized protein n=1 Tax=Gamsiella multidivaricata TaxID=101098 RepID=UPI00221F5D7C
MTGVVARSSHCGVIRTIWTNTMRDTNDFGGKKTVVQVPDRLFFYSGGGALPC